MPAGAVLGRDCSGSRRALAGVLGVLLLASYPVVAQESKGSARHSASARSRAITRGAIVRAIQPATATDLALAMDVPPETLVSASLGGSDPQAVGVATTRVGKFFPRTGTTFAILSTGSVADVETPNTDPGTSTVLTGLKNSQGQDLVQLRLTLRPPQGAKCLSVDFAFYSEEFPEFVGSMFNDAFVAELGASTFTIVGNAVVAPNNFAFDTVGRVISVNTVFGVTPDTLTTYDGATPLVRAVTPLGPSAFPTVDVVFSITDLGDSIFDSTVFLDNFRFTNEDCTAGAFLVLNIISPPSGVYTRDQRFDLLLFEPDAVTGRSGTLNGVDVGGFLFGCFRGLRADEPSFTARCPGLSGAFLESLGPGPYTVKVTETFTNGASASDTVVWRLPSAADPPGLTISPPTGNYATFQEFDLVLILKSASPIVGGTATLDGVDVTAILNACLALTQPEVLPGGGVALRCPRLAGNVFTPGPRVVKVTVTAASGATMSDSVTWQIRPNVEFLTPFPPGPFGSP